MGNTHSHTPSSRSKHLSSTPNGSPPPYTMHSHTPFTPPGLSSRHSNHSNHSNRLSESSQRYSDAKLPSPMDTLNNGPSRNPFLDPTRHYGQANRNNSVSLSDREDQFQLLQKFDTVIVVDDSGSMQGSRWLEARDTLAGIASLAAQYDTNGLDIHFLNSTKIGTNLRSADEVERIFNAVQPRGPTPTGRKLEELLLDYLFRYEGSRPKPKPVNFVILTDGVPTDDPLDVILAAANRLDAQNAPLTQVGIQFVQLGDDWHATQALKEMDDDLSNKYKIRDMVDTTPYTGQALNPDLLGKILLGGINRRVDRIS